MSLSKFMVGSAIGSVPFLSIFVLMGSEMHSIEEAATGEVTITAMT